MKRRQRQRLIFRGLLMSGVATVAAISYAYHTTVKHSADNAVIVAVAPTSHGLVTWHMTERGLTTQRGWTHTVAGVVPPMLRLLLSADNDVTLSLTQPMRNWHLELTAWATATGALRWRRSVPASCANGPAARGPDHIFIFCRDGSETYRTNHLLAYKLEDGSLAWRHPLAQPASSLQLAVPQGLLVDQGATLEVRTPSTGALLTTLRTWLPSDQGTVVRVPDITIEHPTVRVEADLGTWWELPADYALGRIHRDRAWLTAAHAAGARLGVQQAETAAPPWWAAPRPGAIIALAEISAASHSWCDAAMWFVVERTSTCALHALQHTGTADHEAVAWPLAACPQAVHVVCRDAHALAYVDAAPAQLLVYDANLKVAALELTRGHERPRIVTHVSDAQREWLVTTAGLVELSLDTPLPTLHAPPPWQLLHHTETALATPPSGAHQPTP